MIRFACCALVLAAGVSFSSSSAPAHTAFKNALQKKYDFKSVSCNTCHEKGKPKTERTEFGQSFQDGIGALEFDGMSLTEKFEALKENGTEAEKDDFTIVMTESFLEVLKEVVEKENEAGEKWGALLEAGSIDGIKLK